MRMALRLAAKARGRTSPNPLVGAVVVHDGIVVGRGYHRKAGEPHAEALALAEAGQRAANGILYITLEPCSHIDKRTPPCTPVVIKSGVRRVVIAMTDPNPRVSGSGIAALQKAGIQVETGIFEQEAKRLNEAFIKHIQTRMPFVTLKIAQTLDGKIATKTGNSQWITGEQARHEAHKLRNFHDAVLVGINTVLQDNPSLTARIPRGRDPLRVIVDARAEIPLTAKVITQHSSAKTLIATTTRAPKNNVKKIQAAGIDILFVKSVKGRVDLHDLMQQLGARNIMSVLIEGGSEINASALHAGIVDKIIVFLAPLLLCGRESLCSIGGESPSRIEHAFGLKDVTSRFIGNDLMIEGYVQRA